MRTYRRLERVVCALFVAYALAAVFQQLVMRGANRHQLFPVDSWSLFAAVPAEITDYGVRVLELNGERLAVPISVKDTRTRLPALASVDAYQVIQVLGRALRKDDRNAVARARRTLERIYLNGASPCRYDVVRQTYDPMEFWNSGTIRAAQTVGEFDSRTEP